MKRNNNQRLHVVELKAIVNLAIWHVDVMMYIYPLAFPFHFGRADPVINGFYIGIL